MAPYRGLNIVRAVQLREDRVSVREIYGYYTFKWTLLNIGWQSGVPMLWSQLWQQGRYALTDHPNLYKSSPLIHFSHLEVFHWAVMEMVWYRTPHPTCNNVVCRAGRVPCPYTSPVQICFSPRTLPSARPSRSGCRAGEVPQGGLRSPLL